MKLVFRARIRIRRDRVKETEKILKIGTELKEGFFMMIVFFLI
jgi:hypothetical protein